MIHTGSLFFMLLFPYRAAGNTQEEAVSSDAINGVRGSQCPVAVALAVQGLYNNPGAQLCLGLTKQIFEFDFFFIRFSASRLLLLKGETLAFVRKETSSW